MNRSRARLVLTLPGAVAAALVLFLTLGTLLTVALRAESSAGLSASDWAAIRFTLTQASLSALVSIAFAIPLARALARRRFWGRKALITVMGAPFILPVIVAVLGLLAVFGRNGILSQILALFGFEPIQIYGLHGVVLAHVFFNLPLATRLILQGWHGIPAERFRLAAALGFTPKNQFRHIELPMLRNIVPGAALVVFLICTTSFAVALTLGGGPKATTVELAIYQAFRFDFDLGKAATLGLIQFAIGGLAAALAFAATRHNAPAPGLDRQVQMWGHSSLGLRAADTIFITVAAAFLITPLGMVVVRGVLHIAELPMTIYFALFRSLAVALASTVIVCVLAVSMACLIVRIRLGGIVEAVGYVSIAASPLVIGTGLFILLFPVTNPVDWALPVTALVNAVMALPFALRSIVPAMQQIESEFGSLASSLNLKGWPRLRILVLPRLRRPLGFSAGLAAALSMGDLGVVALFADPNSATLPLQLYRLMASYRMDQAAGAALLLLLASLVLFWIFDKGGRHDADA